MLDYALTLTCLALALVALYQKAQHLWWKSLHREAVKRWNAEITEKDEWRKRALTLETDAIVLYDIHKSHTGQDWLNWPHIIE